MAFRLKPDESIQHGLRRLARKELRLARDELRHATPPSDEAIHEARRSVKKVRAILGLIDADDGAGLNSAAARLRKVNRKLSRLRDADAMIQILAKLRKEKPRLLNEHAFARIRRRLWSRKRDAMSDAASSCDWGKVDRQIRQIRQGAKGWQSAHRQFSLLAVGIGRTYRRGRQALRRARKSESAAAFHEWRKEIKALWYALRLIEGCSRHLAKEIKALHSAETWLGDEHNVVVLCGELSSDTSVCRGAVDVDRLRVAADQYQCRLRKKALDRAARLYRRRQSAYVQTIKQAWKTWLRQNANGQPQRQAA